MNPEETSNFNCTSCNTDTLQLGEYYSLKDSIWSAANHHRKEGMKCLNCVETTLNRSLTHEDFTDAPINFGFPMSVKMFTILLPKHRKMDEEYAHRFPPVTPARIEYLNTHPEATHVQ